MRRDRSPRPDPAPVPPELIVRIDRLILEQGVFDPLAVLEDLGLLSSEALDDWRAGRPPGLIARIGHADGGACVRGLRGLLERAAAHAQAQGLLAGPGVPVRATEAEVPHALGAGGGEADRLAELLGARWRPPPDRRQGDLFQDSPDTAQVHDLAQALAGQQPDAARAALARLKRVSPGHPQLAAWSGLLEAASGLRAPLPVPDGPAGVRAAWAETAGRAELAGRLLGRDGAGLTAALWSQLALALDGLAWDPAAPELHASAAWARAGRHAEARQAIEVEAGWQDQPDLVAWHAHCCWSAGDQRAARAGWLGLCWHHPQTASRVLDARDLPDRTLGLAWQDFGDLDDPLPIPMFPAWLCLGHSELAHALDLDRLPEDAPGAAFRRLRSLMAGDDGPAQRKALALLDRRLLALYLAHSPGHQLSSMMSAMR